MTAEKRPATSSRVTALLSRIRSNRGRAIFALDATASRQPVWDTSAKLTADMFSATTGLSVQLLHYRGISECTASRWMDDPRALAIAMSTITCRAGETQIYRVLHHIKQENERERVNVGIFIGDYCEEDPTDLIKRARGLSTPLFLFQEGNDQATATLFRELAEITHGAYAAFDVRAADSLKDLLRAAAVFAAGGREALSNQQTNAARLLLNQIK